MRVKPAIRQIENEEGCLIIDDTIQEKGWTDENELIYWRFDHCSGRTVKGINLLNALIKASQQAYQQLQKLQAA